MTDAGDADRVIEDLENTIDRLRRENEYLRRQAMKFDVFERPEALVQTLEHNLPYYTSNDWQKVIELIARRLSETCP
jgi:chromosome segregation ATPase